MNRSVLVAVIVAVVGCSGEQTGSEAIETTTEALNVSKFTNWQRLPGLGNAVHRPAIYSSYGDANNRWWSVCATTTNSKLLCNSRIKFAGSDTGWQTSWSEATPPTGVTFGPLGSGPALTQWNNNQGASFGGLAAREASGNCPGCIWLRVSQHGVSSVWHQVPNSGVANGFTATSNISLVVSNGSLYVVASKCGATTCTAHFIKNNSLGAGYSNASWSSWVADPAGGVFNQPIVASAFSTNGNIIVSGLGTDNRAWISRIFPFSGWEGGWSQVGGWGIFNDSPSATTFSSTADAVALFGLGTDFGQWQGDLNASRTAFDGWYRWGDAFFIKSPAAHAPANNVITLAAWAEDPDGAPIMVSDYAGP
jgi:hypothetical protein